VQHEPTAPIDPQLTRKAASLRERAVDLRAVTGTGRLSDDLVATAFRRRAAELELAAWAFDARAGVLEAVEPTHAASIPVAA